MAKNYDSEDKLYDYDPNEDYQALIDQAVNAGDLSAAAKYEQQRNEKITGEGLTQYQPTNQYVQHLAGGEAQPSYAQQMDELFGQIMNREPFSYDLNGDALYQQYKDKYMSQGKLAMQDTMGQAAALTGGYGNSYAQTVGQQAYNQYLGGLNDIVPELYALARDRYDAEGNALLNQYSLLADRENTEYSRQSAEEEKAYSLALSMLQSGIMPSSEVLDASGLSMEDAQAIYDAAAGQSGSGSGSNSGGGYTFTRINDVSELGPTAMNIANSFSRADSDVNANGNFEIILNALAEGSITVGEAAFLAASVGIGSGSEEDGNILANMAGLT